MDINYNSVEEIERYVTDLNKLKEFSKYRHELGYKKGLSMNNIKINDDDILFDTCGNTWIRKAKGSDSYVMGVFPDNDYVCPYCGEKFNIYKLVSDCVVRQMGYKENNDGTMSPIYNFYHKKCILFDKEASQREEFIRIFNVIYKLHMKDFKPIPNKYCDCDSCSPWFIVDTPDGKIQIGWRKRVINIKWLDYKDFTDKFDDEDVTKGFGKYGDKERFIHAWGVEKAIEYIVRAKKSIIC